MMARIKLLLIKRLQDMNLDESKQISNLKIIVSIDPEKVEKDCSMDFSL